MLVEVPGPDGSYISYTFTPFGGGTPGAGDGNHLDQFEAFKKDPIAAIASGKYRTDQQMMSTMIKDMAVSLMLGRVMRGRVPAGGKIPTTQANATKGWKLGDPINNLTASGGVPSWGAVRQRYWKNRAFTAKKGDFTDENIQRMQKGLAPQQYNTETGKMESKELHHTPPQREGGLFDFVEVWPLEHEMIDQHRRTGNGTH